MRNPLRLGFLRGAPEQPTIRERLAAGRAGLARIAGRPAPQAESGASRRAVMGGALAAAVPLPALAAPSDLARTCDAAVARLTWVNHNDEPDDLWTDERITEENRCFDAVLDRMADEPARGSGDLAAKARLLLCEHRHSVGGKVTNAGERALSTLLEEIAALDPQLPATAT